jgi:dihydrofolate synthase/folylpolyglutamate synthase
MSKKYFDTLRALAKPIRAADLPHTLDHIHRLLDALGNPQRQFRSIVVAGSTGKGTTCVRLADFLSISGLKVGLYTSPHLHSFRERIAVLEQSPEQVVDAATPQRLISQSEFVKAAQRVLAEQQTLNHTYSTFETTTALALHWFAQQHVDIAVLEVGIGGRFDAVNAVANTVAVFTPIEAEHVAMLGGSLESVAWHKAGIIQPNSTAISVPQSPAVQSVLEREARDKSATLHFTSDPVSLIPDLLPSIFPLRTRYSVLGTSLPGRLERLARDNHSVIIDGGHTPTAARYLHPSILHAKSVRFIVGMLRDKNVAAYLSTFDLSQFRFVYTQASGDRALTPEELLACYRHTQASVTLVPSLDEALAQAETAPEELIVVAGSLRMAAAAREAFGLLSAEDLEEARLTRAIFEGEAYQRKLN